jgi:hypothetical protein
MKKIVPYFILSLLFTTQTFSQQWDQLPVPKVETDRPGGPPLPPSVPSAPQVPLPNNYPHENPGNPRPSPTVPGLDILLELKDALLTRATGILLLKVTLAVGAILGTAVAVAFFSGGTLAIPAGAGSVGAAISAILLLIMNTDVLTDEQKQRFAPYQGASIKLIESTDGLVIEGVDGIGRIEIDVDETSQAWTVTTEDTCVKGMGLLAGKDC